MGLSKGRNIRSCKEIVVVKAWFWLSLADQRTRKGTLTNHMRYLDMEFAYMGIKQKWPMSQTAELFYLRKWKTDKHANIAHAQWCLSRIYYR